MERDLKRICDALPVSDTGDSSTQANSILKGLTGEDVEFNIGGNQPTLFPAPIIQTLNKVTVQPTNTSALNGGFANAILQKVYINDVEIQLTNNEYYVQPSDDGKTLKVSLTRDLFGEAISTVTLQYLDTSGGVITINASIEGTPGTQRAGVLLRNRPYTAGSRKYSCYRDNVEVTRDEYCWILKVVNGTIMVMQTLPSMSFRITNSDGTPIHVQQDNWNVAVGYVFHVYIAQLAASSSPTLGTWFTGWPSSDIGAWSGFDIYGESIFDVFIDEDFYFTSPTVSAHVEPWPSGQYYKIVQKTENTPPNWTNRGSDPMPYYDSQVLKLNLGLNFRVVWPQ